MNGEHGEFDGVKYKDHRELKLWEPMDIFVSFKSRNILVQSINAKKIIHWSTEIEPPWKDFELKNIDLILPISDYHKSHFKKNKKIQTAYLWADLKRLKENKVTKEKGTMLYASSFDRGLEELLTRWPEVQKQLGVKKLYITYGWDFIDKLIKADPKRAPWKNQMLKLMEQDGIEMLGRLSNNKMCGMYWKSEYWCLPLSNPQSELFCLNAVKASYSNCIPVVRRIGALQETVHNYLDFDKLLGEKIGKDSFPKNALEENRKYVEDKFSMEKQVKEWEKLLS